MSKKQDKPTQPERIAGQIDAFEMMEIVAKEGLVPAPPGDDSGAIEKDAFLRNVDTDLEVMRDDRYAFWVVDADGNKLHEQPFWAQIECWAFIVGWERGVKYRKQL